LVAGHTQFAAPKLVDQIGMLLLLGAILLFICLPSRACG